VGVALASDGATSCAITTGGALIATAIAMAIFFGFKGLPKSSSGSTLERFDIPTPDCIYLNVLPS
jgi:hypothetical protein